MIFTTSPRGRFLIGKIYLKSMGLIQYLNETKAELKHVSWPTRAQAVRFTVAVIVLSIVTAYFLGLFDFLFTKVLDISVLKTK